MFSGGIFLNPFRAPELLPILNPSKFVPENGFPVVKRLSSQIEEPHKKSGACLSYPESYRYRADVCVLVLSSVVKKRIHGPDISVLLDHQGIHASWVGKPAKRTAVEIGVLRRTKASVGGLVFVVWFGLVPQNLTPDSLRP